MLTILNWLSSFGTWIAKLLFSDREAIIDGNNRILQGFDRLISQQDQRFERVMKEFGEMKSVIETLRSKLDEKEEAIYQLRLELQKTQFERDREIAKGIEANQQKQKSG